MSSEADCYRLSRPSLVSQYPVAAPLSSAQPPPTVPASLSYRGGDAGGASASTNTDPFLLSPIVNLPPAFGSAYVGESFACTLCVNHDAPAGIADASAAPHKTIRDVHIEAEMKTPDTNIGIVKLKLTPDGVLSTEGGTATASTSGIDLEVGETLQRVVRFDLKEEGNHVLVVTVSYYEATETSGRTRTFRKLYQFICKSALIVRTKAAVFRSSTPKLKRNSTASSNDAGYRQWMLEAQLENCGEDVVQLDQVVLHLEPALTYADCNGWQIGEEDSKLVDAKASIASRGSRRPVLQPGEVEQVCFLIQETAPGLVEQGNGRLIFGVLGIGWRGEMGSRGYLSTGKLGTRVAR